MPLGPNDPRVLVEGNPLAGFGLDTRHTLQPSGLTSARVVRLPGSNTGFAIKGSAPPPPIVVTGVLLADNFDALHALIRQHHAWIAATGIVTVRLYETDYANCTPMDFRVTSRPTAYSDDGGQTTKARVNARFVFEQLQ